jgi:hypothetical protein
MLQLKQCIETRTAARSAGFLLSVRFVMDVAVDAVLLHT